MDDVIDKRLTDLESLFTDLPDLLNIRLERIDKALKANEGRFDEMAGRLNLLDKQMGMMIRDMRDMRSGVTRQLMEQDKEIAAIKTDVAGIKTDVAGMKTDVGELKSRMSNLELGMAELLRRVPKT